MWRRFGGKLWRWLRRDPRLSGPALWRFLTRPGPWRHRHRLAGGGDFRQRLHLFLSAERNFQHAALLFGRSAQSMPADDQRVSRICLSNAEGRLVRTLRDQIARLR